ncbi:MAG: PAS domain-containing sensor histidine kinase [Nitrospirota bacterium]
MGEKIKGRRKEGTPDLPLLSELVTEYSSLPMAAVEAGGYILRYVNPAFCRLVGKKREEMVGNPFVQAVPEGKACLPVFDHVYQTGERAECESRWSYAIWAIPAAGGSHAGVMVLATDKTEDALVRQKAAAMNQELMLSVVRQHELTEAAEKLNAQLRLEMAERKKAEEALNKQKADFYAMITHDVKSPLTSVLGYSELMMSRADKYDADTNEMIAAIMRSGERIDHLIDNFLTISKMESAKVVINPVPTDIAALLRDACSEIERAVNKKKLDLKMEIADGLPEATVDSKLIERAVMNLLHNAVNYTPSPGTIALKAVFDGKNFIIISVTDTGKGIPAGERQAIFEQYYRSQRTAGVKGSGLGLAIVKTAAEAHGGRVEVESEVGRGSTFRLFLPVKKGRK